MNDTNTTAICNDNPRNSESGQNLCELVDTPLFGTRPVQPREPQRISFIGGQTFKVRLPDIGEIGLSDAEVDHAMTYGVSA